MWALFTGCVHKLQKLSGGQVHTRLPTVAVKTVVGAETVLASASDDNSLSLARLCLTLAIRCDLCVVLPWAWHAKGLSSYPTTPGFALAHVCVQQYHQLCTPLSRSPLARRTGMPEVCGDMLCTDSKSHECGSRTGRPLVRRSPYCGQEEKIKNATSGPD